MSQLSGSLPRDTQTERLRRLQENRGRDAGLCLPMMSSLVSMGQTPPSWPFFLMIVSLHDMARLFLGTELPLAKCFSPSSRAGPESLKKSS